MNLIRPTALAFLLAGSAWAATTDLADARGFIDVWRLRAETLAAEARMVPDDAGEACEHEGSDEEPPTLRERLRQARAQRACERDVARRKDRSDAALAAYNARWRPVLVAAMAQGDPVAEVVLRQCATTPALDRRGIESTCDEDPARRAVAARRLKAIGFVPAFDRVSEQPALAHNDPRLRGTMQEYALARMRQGDFAIDRQSIYHGGNAPATAEELQDIRRWLLIDAVLSEARRAFVFSPGSDWRTSRFAVPALAREPLVPGYLTWGRALHYGGGNSAYSGPHDWRAGGRENYLRFERGRRVVLGGREDAEFLRQLHDVLAAAEAAIDAQLQRDPRWAVFLLTRRGRHEWVPEGTRSRSGELRGPWLGPWTLQRSFADWSETPQAEAAAPARATISRENDRSWIDFDSPDGRYRCELRYSGGSSYLPEGGRHDTSATHTALGYLPAVSRQVGAGAPGPLAPFAPLDPAKRYRQVLVHCPQGEAEDNRTVRFLLLSQDTLIEVHRDPERMPVAQLRHYQRGGEPVEAAPYAEPRPREYLARLDALARDAEAARDRIEKASVAQLIASLRSSRTESLYYSRDALPANVQALARRPDAVQPLAEALGRETDPLVRFNLVMLLAHQLQGTGASIAERQLAGDRLVHALDDPHPWVRTEAAWGLRFSGSRKHAQALRPLLADADPQVRSEARESLRLLEPGTP